ncbi:1-phosphatidylinositol phosphodiesterase [Ceratocystis platani]|uniref:1-phosphatidylinositol phosphodiesterase n=1 Tax=Ceratocystis fimbriata f. sp. platani TaxID=88771 RepID=A0A0F8BJI7_CERFI|nr:1-phosphatidylinositol phosphodiesterase [Ceratocystis platani]
MRFSLLATLASLALSRAAIYGGFDDPWSFDLTQGSYNNWMHYIADGVSLASLTIPGTHNSMTVNIRDDLMQSQNTDLAQQLNGGIRYIDVSCMTMDNSLVVTHGDALTGYTFDYVLATLYQFLDRNPREAVILRIQKGNPLESSASLAANIRRSLNPGTELGNRAADRIFSRGGYNIDTIPTLGEVRGKVFILQDFDTSSGQFGLPWSSRLISYYHFKFGLKKLLKAKWLVVHSYFTLSLNNAEKLYVTDVTVSVGSRPITFAAGPHIDPGMNARLGKYFQKADPSPRSRFSWGSNKGYFGVIVMDFPGKSLVEQLLKFNKRYEVVPPGFPAPTRPGFSPNPAFPPAPNYGNPPAANYHGFPPSNAPPNYGAAYANGAAPNYGAGQPYGQPNPGAYPHPGAYPPAGNHRDPSSSNSQ